MIDSIDSQQKPILSDESIISDITTASQDTYRTLAETGHNPEEVHRLALCYQASSLMVNNLVSNGYKAKHEISSGWTVLEHSYVTIETGHGDEMIVDPTWQQFLPKDRVTEDIPKVLVGSRNNVIQQARHFGVDELTAQLWQKQANKMTVEQQKQADFEAQKAEDLAAESGGWERFMATHKK